MSPDALSQFPKQAGKVGDHGARSTGLPALTEAASSLLHHSNTCLGWPDEPIPFHVEQAWLFCQQPAVLRLWLAPLCCSPGRLAGLQESLQSEPGVGVE